MSPKDSRRNGDPRKIVILNVPDGLNVRRGFVGYGLRPPLDGFEAAETLVSSCPVVKKYPAGVVQ